MSERKNLLIVTEGFTFGGLETHIRGEIKELAVNNVVTHLATGPAYMHDFVPNEVASVTSGLSIKIDTTIEQLLRSIESLRSLIREQGITIVHAHPFMSLLPAYLAARLEGVPCVVTLHGPASINGSYGVLYDYVNSIILQQSDSVIVVSDELAKMAAPYTPTELLTVQPNTVHIPKHRKISKATEINKWLVAARLDELKVVGIKRFIECVHTVSTATIDIAGEGPEKTSLQQWCSKNGYDRVNFLGLVNNLQMIMNSYDAIAGMGRVVLESLAYGKRTCIVGYSGVKAMVNDAGTLLQASAYNFSGRGLTDIDGVELQKQILMYDPRRFEKVIEKIEQTYDESKTWHSFARSIEALKHDNKKDDLLVDVYNWLQSHAAKSGETWINSAIIWNALGLILASHKYADSNPAKIFGVVSTMATQQKNEQSILEVGKLESEAAKTRQATLARIEENLKATDGNLKRVVATIDEEIKKSQATLARIEENLKATDGNLKRVVAEELKHKEQDIKRAFIEELNRRDENTRRLDALVNSRRFKAANRIASLTAVIAPKDSYRRKAVSRLLKSTTDIKRSIRLKKECKLIEKSGLFDEQYYLSKYKDLSDVADPLLHYLMHGWKEGRRPSPYFSTRYYMSMNPDVVDSQINPLLHYILYGRSESRLGYDKSTEDYVATSRRVVAMQVESFDKGGLEEVVLELAKNKQIKQKYQPIILDVAGDGGYMAAVADKYDIPVIHLKHNSALLDYYIYECKLSLVHLHYSVFGISNYKLNNVKTVYTVHNNYIWADSSFIEQRKQIYNNIDTFVAVSSQVKDFFVTKFAQSPKKVKVISNGISITTAENIKKVDRKDLDLNKNDYVLINIASFNINKFHPLMIVAISKICVRYPNIKLIMVGNIADNSYYENVIELIRKYGVEKHIIILDYVPKDMVLGLLDIADAFLQPSLTEGFSVAVVEAMYRKLPLILADVGGARDVIKNSDIGLIVKEPYRDIVDLSTNELLIKYGDDSSLNNIDELVEAISDFVTNKEHWSLRGEKGRDKVIQTFNDNMMAKKYITIYENLLIDDREKVQKQLEKALDELDICVVAPFPSSERISEGWMSRISAIDSIISDKKRLYIHISAIDTPILHTYAERGWELIISPSDEDFNKILSSIIKRARIMYVHTLHLAEYILPWIKSGKVIVDIHGITPEEEVMMGRPELQEKYEKVEKVVLNNARACVMVTNAMRLHYESKYPYIKSHKIILLPIVESISAQKRKYNDAVNKIRIVYSGGTQPWQNIPSMLKLASSLSSIANFTFLSHDWQNIQTQGVRKKNSDSTKYSFCPKNKLVEAYFKQDMGLVLRDDTPVNRVACPTKLFEYMVCGVIPIVRFSAMGDFEEFGYRYVLENDILTSKIPPSSAEADKMIAANYKAVEKMIKRFQVGSKMLRRELV